MNESRPGLPLDFSRLSRQPAEDAAPEAPRHAAPTGGRFDTSEAISQGKPSDDAYLRDMFDSDDEDAAIAQIREGRGGHQINYSNKNAEIDERLKRSLDKLRHKYPHGGIKSAQFITLDILMDAPEDYFFRFETLARSGVEWIQGVLAEKGISDIIGKAQADPYDLELQDRAYRQIQGVAIEYMERSTLKGIDRQTVTYLMCSDILGLSRLEPLWRDRSVDEIICNGPFDVQIEIRGQLHKVPSLKFRDRSHLEVMLERIFDRIGKTLSATTPLLNGRLHDNSRIFATHHVISPEGPNVAIRRHPEKFWTPMDLLASNSASEEMLTELGNLIHKGASYMVIGGTSSGKTSLLNATSGFFNAEQRVLSLEDDLELKLNPTKKLGAPMECKPANPNKEGDLGVTMRDLVKASLRMRPNGIVIGEVRDGAMYDLCQALNTGHWGCSTVHANSPEDGIYRMASLVAQADLIKGDSILDLIAAAFDFVIMQERFDQDGSRKITSISEVDYRPSMGEDGRVQLGVKRLWEFQEAGVDADGKVLGTWVKKGEMSERRRKLKHLDLTENLSWEKLVEIATIPDALQRSA